MLMVLAILEDATEFTDRRTVGLVLKVLRSDQRS